MIKLVKIMNNILFLDQNLIIKFIRENIPDGRVSKIIEEVSSSETNGVNLLFKLISTQIGFKSIYNENVKKIVETTPEEYGYLINTLTNIDLNKTICTYDKSLSLESKAIKVHYLIIKCYASWIKTVESNIIEGDLVVYNAYNTIVPVGIHIAKMDYSSNIAQDYSGTHCRNVTALTFWHDGFSNSKKYPLSECQIMAIWD